MVTRYGMVEELGYVAYEPQRSAFLEAPAGLGQGGCPVSQATAQRIDEAIRTLVMDEFQRTYTLLQDNRPVLERCAQALLARETLDEAALQELTQGLKPPD